MNFIQTEIKDVVIIVPELFEDHRGFFMESWSKRAFEEAGFFYNFVQDNCASSFSKGTLRGIHFQRGSKAQAKLGRCVFGAVLDVAVDLRRDSPTYKRWVAVELSEKNRYQLLIPRGFGHGYVTLTDEAQFFYKVDNCYDREADSGIRWNDPELAVDWGIHAPILSERDKNSPWLKNAVTGF